MTPKTLKILLLAFVCLMPLHLPAKSFTVVIDAGHGGKDTGCLGKKTKEKDVVLDVALSLGRRIKRKYNDKVKVIYTRDNDRFITLGERARIANRNNADLMISIHVNSVDESTKGREKLAGSSIYIFTPEKYPGNFNILSRLSSIKTINRRGREGFEKYNSGNAESTIAFELLQQEYVDRSIDLAHMMLDELKKKAGRQNKGIRQGPFEVLWSSMAPAVLVELEYMCNPESEKYLGTKKGIDQMSEALFEAFNKYYKKYKA